jgi:hypothetical protein
LSDNKEDLELEALQRELDHAFATTRPRRGFEDELWLWMQARRPLWTRLRDAIGSMGALFREAPAIPLGAVAVLLVVVIGAGILLNSGLRLSPSHSSSAAGVAQAPDLALGGEFGKLPTPVLHPGLVDQGVPAPAAYAPPQPAAALASNLYFGPATLRWTGQMPSLPATGIVFRYAEPGVGAADQFAASIGGSVTKQAAGPGLPGTYSGQSFTVSIRGTVPQLPREPYFVLMPSGYSATSVDEQAAATSFLDHFNLEPTWPNTLDAQGSPEQARVILQRYFATTNGPAYLVDWIGEKYGIEVDISNRQVRAVSGPLPLSLDGANYRLISNDDAVRAALASAPASSQGIQPVPTVDLNKVELVYSLAVSNGQGFYEPAYLFSGTFEYNGQTYTKRVLIPLVDPSLRS